MTPKAAPSAPGWAHARLFVLAVALAAALPYALKFAADHDLWWHVRTGQLILEDGELPRGDPFSFTAPGAAWTNHEWLSDVIVGSLFARGGDRALSAWRMLLLLSTVTVFAALLWRRWPRPVPLLAGVLLTVPLIRIFINLRPHSYTYLFTLVLLWILETSPDRPRRLWGVPALIALWTNLHGGFLLGIGLLGVWAATRWTGLDGGERPPDRDERVRLALVLSASALAPLLNPYGLGLLTYLIRELGADHSLILEWSGIWTFPGHRWHYALLCAVPVTVLALARQLRPAAPVVMLGLAAAGTWIHGRFLILLVLFSALVSFSALATLDRRHPRPGRLLRRLDAPGWAWGLCALPLIAGALQLSVDLGKRGLRLQIDPWHVPIEACEFLDRHDLGPNLLLRFDWGGYAIWHLAPRYKVSGDGRNLTVYDAGLVDTLLRSYHEGRFAELAAEHDADVILSESAGPTYRELEADASWTRVHQDRVAAVYVRPEVARDLPRRRVTPDRPQPASERFFFP